MWFVQAPLEAGEIRRQIAAQGFSGEVTYEGAFEWGTPGRDALLELADLRQAAEVEVNGACIGAILWKPWALVIPRQYLKAGSNAIRLTVRNTLADYCRSDEFIAAYRRHGLEPENYWKIGEGLDARVKGIGIQTDG